jgi:hypothetical protein
MVQQYLFTSQVDPCSIGRYNLDVVCVQLAVNIRRWLGQSCLRDPEVPPR